MKKLAGIIVVFFALTGCEEKRNATIRNINQEEFAKLNTQEIQLLDVRTPKEVTLGCIKGAIAINYFDNDFESQVQSKFNKDKPLYIYCASGGRSSKASSQLIQIGFNKVYNLKGGYTEWIQKQEK